MLTATIYQPSYGPQGEPYMVRTRLADGIVESHYWTENEAMDARDAALDSGALSAHVAGLPCRVVSNLDADQDMLIIA